MSDSPSENQDVNPGQETVGGSSANVEDVFADLDSLADDSESEAALDQIAEIRELLVAAHDRELIESGVRRLAPSDAAQAFVGSVIFATPLLVEDGVFDIAAYLFDFTVYGVPVFLIANTIFVVVMTYALLEWTGKEQQDHRVLFGVIPTRVVMVLTVSFVVAAVLMTVWGRVGTWQSTTEALARVNVIWTVGSLGAGLGDIVSGNESPPVSTLIEDGVPETPVVASAPPDETDGPRDTEHLTDAALVTAIQDRFDTLESAVTGPEQRQEVRRMKERADVAAVDAAFGDLVRKYTTRDVAEAFVGSIFFSIPFLVEDGVFDVARYFLSFRIGQFPVLFLVNTAFVLVMVTALVYWAGPQDVRMSRPIFGFVPRRLVGISLVSFLTVAALMTMWGRVDGWQDPVVAVARITVVWTVASFGAALGDILPGESSGDDINDDLAELGDQIEELVD